MKSKHRGKETCMHPYDRRVVVLRVTGIVLTSGPMTSPLDNFIFCLQCYVSKKCPAVSCILNNLKCGMDEAISVWATPAIHNLPWFLFSPGILYFHLIVFSPGIACLITVIIMLYSISKANQTLALSNMVSAALLPARHYLCDICTL